MRKIVNDDQWDSLIAITDTFYGYCGPTLPIRSHMITPRKPLPVFEHVSEISRKDRHKSMRKSVKRFLTGIFAKTND